MADSGDPIPGRRWWAGASCPPRPHSPALSPGGREGEKQPFAPLFPSISRPPSPPGRGIEGEASKGRPSRRAGRSWVLSVIEPLASPLRPPPSAGLGLGLGAEPPLAGAGLDGDVVVVLLARDVVDPLPGLEVDVPLDEAAGRLRLATRGADAAGAFRAAGPGGGRPPARRGRGGRRQVAVRLRRLVLLARGAGGADACGGEEEEQVSLHDDLLWEMDPSSLSPHCSEDHRGRGHGDQGPGAFRLSHRLSSVVVSAPDTNA